LNSADLTKQEVEDSIANYCNKSLNGEAVPLSASKGIKDTVTPTARLTGKKADGTPDLRTTKGKILAAQNTESEAEPSRLAARITGTKADGTPDMRTTEGRKLAAKQAQQIAEDAAIAVQLQQKFDQEIANISSRPVSAGNRSSTAARITGTKADGTPDMRTTEGRKLAAKQAEQIAKDAAMAVQLQQELVKASNSRVSTNSSVRGGLSTTSLKSTSTSRAANAWNIFQHENKGIYTRPQLREAYYQQPSIVSYQSSPQYYGSSSLSSVSVSSSGSSRGSNSWNTFQHEHKGMYTRSKMREAYRNR
jgi:hypothetical protein